MQQKKTYFTSTRMAVLAIFAALAGILQCFSFPMPILFASWLELNFSDIPTLIGTFALGPLAGCIIVLFKVLIRLIVRGTSTMFVGDLADVLIGIAFVLPAGLIYQKKRTFKGALIGMTVGMVSTTVMAMLFNWLILVPFYVKLFFGGNFGVLLGMFQQTIPSVTEANFYAVYLFASVLPFNVMRSLIAILVTLAVYKHISRLINAVGDKAEAKHKSDTPEQTNIRKAIMWSIVGVVAVAIVVLAVLRGFEII